jgi:hypothetical protein
MKEELIELTVLMDFLGYGDQRSAIRWCTRNKIAVMQAGRKKYILSQAIKYIVDNQLVIFDNSNSEPSKIIEKEPEKIIKPIIEARSDAAKKFLKNIKTL